MACSTGWVTWRREKNRKRKGVQSPQRSKLVTLPGGKNALRLVVARPQSFEQVGDWQKI